MKQETVTIEKETVISVILTIVAEFNKDARQHDELLMLNTNYRYAIKEIDRLKQLLFIDDNEICETLNDCRAELSGIYDELHDACIKKKVFPYNKKRIKRG